MKKYILRITFAFLFLLSASSSIYIQFQKTENSFFFGSPSAHFEADTIDEYSDDDGGVPIIHFIADFFNFLKDF